MDRGTGVMFSDIGDWRGLGSACASWRSGLDLSVSTNLDISEDNDAAKVGGRIGAFLVA